MPLKIYGVIFILRLDFSWRLLHNNWLHLFYNMILICFSNTFLINRNKIIGFLIIIPILLSILSSFSS